MVGKLFNLPVLNNYMEYKPILYYLLNRYSYSLPSADPVKISIYNPQKLSEGVESIYNQFKRMELPVPNLQLLDPNKLDKSVQELYDLGNNLNFGLASYFLPKYMPRSSNSY